MLIKYLKIDQQKNKIDTCTPKSSTMYLTLKANSGCTQTLPNLKKPEVHRITHRVSQQTYDHKEL